MIRAAILLLFLAAPLAGREPASVATVDPGDLVGYEEYPEPLRKLVEAALELTTKDLTYEFGSASPDNGGMDCSGTIQFALGTVGMEGLPRSSYGFYQWAKEQSSLIEAGQAESIDDPVFDELAPGDLLFWKGTYETDGRDPPISHVMIFLGWHEEDGRGVVFGASDGRRYRGKKIRGVSVFDWTVPKPGSSSRFVAYGPIPGFVTEYTDEVEQEEKKLGLLRLKSGLANLFKKTEASHR